jgi:prefoldin subunit 4
VLDDELKQKQVCEIFRPCLGLRSDLLTVGFQKEKEDLEEVSTELELADEDDKVPYVSFRTYFVRKPNAGFNLLLIYRYKIGDSFFSIPLPEAQSMLSASTEKLTDEVTALEESLSKLREEMHDLKVALYARFGKSINLET